MAVIPSLYSQVQLRHKDDIRLIKILQCKDGKISCKLVTASLFEKPQFVAISYTWGPSTNAEAARGRGSTPSHRILCNNYELLVTENLHGFLIRAAENTGLASRYMWIDSICIDQSASLERTLQVQLMATIYHAAATVVVINPRNLNSKQTLQMVAPCGDISFWRSLAQLFQRRYFTRVWIIQEIALARERLTVCGKYTINWDHVVKVSKLLTVTSWTRWICPGGIPAMAGKYQSNHAIPYILEATKQSKEKNESNIMLYSFIRSHRFEASDPRDKVYALLGVAGDMVTGKARYNPVYGVRSTANTYKLAAIQILLDSDDLLLLAYAEGEVFQTIPALPSWVPDWSSTRVVGLGVTGYKSGKRIDTITSTSESKEDILKGKPFPRLLHMLCTFPRPYHTKQSPSEVFWRTLLTDTAGLPPVHPASGDCAVGFLSWFGSRLRVMREDVGGALLSDVLEILAIDGLDLSTLEPVASSNEHDQTGDSPGASEYEATFSHSPHLRAFLTPDKYFGLGSRVPLILRQAGHGAFRLVGGAYVHGLMHGEALKSGERLREIRLH
ncbi:hypothetical protein P154DRAFT_543670 [Amniculicola lignicola CBS 123094]|uniref:Heterokaryon incompatibility domain-containing protein n=1 Tax=Amniculicola lignicola CBS 123094 TaxID=1392246 RepID=A0A6A5WPE8_9PLEO|nr:hypothetical protein P154DRAFT_543670 [Amniculicola lignicola CBS 123094]